MWVRDAQLWVDLIISLTLYICTMYIPLIFIIIIIIYAESSTNIINFFINIYGLRSVFTIVHGQWTCEFNYSTSLRG